MIRYTIHTETKENLERLVAIHFEAFTLLNGLGYWKGLKEQSTSIVILVDQDKEGDRRRDVKYLVDDIKAFNNQEAVLVEAELVTANLW